MATLQFREVRIADLKSAHYNPTVRTKKVNIRDLVNSIGKVGLIYPITITKDNVIIDGHRRVAAYKQLGLDTIPAIIGRGDPNELYAAVNATSRKLGGNEALIVYLKEPLAVTPLLKARLDVMVEKLGVERVRKLAKEGYSIRLYNRARQIMLYCDQDEARLVQIFDWILNTQPVGPLLEAMNHDFSPRTIMQACRSGRRIRLRAVISD